LSLTAKDPDFGYTGRGSGVPRIIRLCREHTAPVSFVNDLERSTLRVIFGRRG
jgi:hypothetical protein